jgi:hypothetical protein
MSKEASSPAFPYEAYRAIDEAQLRQLGNLIPWPSTLRARGRLTVTRRPTSTSELAIWPRATPDASG